LGKVEERHIQVEVQEKPEMIVNQEPQMAEEEGKIRMKCHAKGKPVPEYEWVNRRGQVLSEIERHVVDK